MVNELTVNGSLSGSTNPCTKLITRLGSFCEMVIGKTFPVGAPLVTLFMFAVAAAPMLPAASFTITLSVTLPSGIV